VCTKHCRKSRSRMWRLALVLIADRVLGMANVPTRSHGWKLTFTVWSCAFYPMGSREAFNFSRDRVLVCESLEN
jgi:hypothetical protein